MKKEFTRKDLIHDAIETIRFRKVMFDETLRVYGYALASVDRDAAFDIVKSLRCLHVIDSDKRDLLSRIVSKMFYD